MNPGGGQFNDQGKNLSVLFCYVLRIDYTAMKTSLLLLSLLIVSSIFVTSPLAAQDLVINNVRIIVGTGPVIDQGTIVIRGGRIASAGSGNTAAPGLKAIDGKGLTAVAGYIDDHRHIAPGRD